MNSIEYLKSNDFTLVLSGGGALGIAHLGVWHDMELQSLVPKEIVGTSMGGIIGACMAIGMSQKETYYNIKKFSNIFNWIKLSFRGNSVVDNQKIDKIFDKIFKNMKMSDVKIPLKLIATNLNDGSKKVFDDSSDIHIKDALLSTMAIPGIFEEFIIDHESYGDGFICDNLAIEDASYSTVLAINVLGKNSFESDMPDNFFKTANVLEMLEKTIRLMIYNQSKQTIKHSNKTIYLIEPTTKEYKTSQFHKYNEIKKLGIGLL